jgi:ribosomal protein L21E
MPAINGLKLNSVTEEFYEREVGSIFEKEEDCIKVEVRCSSSATLSGYERNGQVLIQAGKSIFVIVTLKVAFDKVKGVDVDTSHLCW